MLAEVPAPLIKGGRGERRQTTFWDLRTRDGLRSFRVHFVRKVEFHFASREFDTAVAVARHPVLVDHSEPEDAVFISTRVDQADGLLRELGDLARDFFAGWRPLERYLNPDYSARRMLAEGSGMLIRAPRSFAEACVAVLARAGVRVDHVSRGVTPAGRVQALLLGRSFVVAAAFRFDATGFDHDVGLG